MRTRVEPPIALVSVEEMLLSLVQKSLLLGTQSNGQGHETAYAQIAADLLGLPFETFRYVQADSREIPRGNGHGGARSMHQGGFALYRAAEAVIAKGRTIAARLLQADAAELDFAEGRPSTILNQSARGQSAALPSPPAL